jgi:hypothetical protein
MQGTSTPISIHLNLVLKDMTTNMLACITEFTGSACLNADSAELIKLLDIIGAILE